MVLCGWYTYYITSATSATSSTILYIWAHLNVGRTKQEKTFHLLHYDDIYPPLTHTQDKRMNKIKIIKIYINQYDAFVSCLRYSLVCIFADVVNVVIVDVVVVIVVVMI